MTQAFVAPAALDDSAYADQLIAQWNKSRPTTLADLFEADLAETPGALNHAESANQKLADLFEADLAATSNPTAANRNLQDLFAEDLR
jgi:hypothetical protein